MPGEIDKRREEKGLNAIPLEARSRDKVQAVGGRESLCFGTSSSDKKSASDREDGPAKEKWWKRCCIDLKLGYTVFFASVLNLSYGNALAFSSPFIDELTRNINSTIWSEGFDNCFYQSLIGPSILLGAIIGGISSSLFIAIFGLVFPLCLAALMFVVSWSMIGVSWFVSSPIAFRSLILAGRFLSGFADGWGTSVWTVYVGEVSPSNYRTSFIGVGYVLYAVGLMETYFLGSFLPFWICAFIYSGTIVVAIPFILLTLPEPPNRPRNIATSAKNFLSGIRSKFNLSLFPCKFQGHFLKRLLKIEIVFFFSGFMGHVAIVQYTGPILEVAGASQWRIPHGVLLAITVGGIEMVGSILAILISRKLGHILSCCIGAAGMCLGHLGMGAYFTIVVGFGPSVNQMANEYTKLNDTGSGIVSEMQLCFFNPAAPNSDLGERYSPLALISMAVVMVMYGMFWMMQPFVIAVELLTDDIRSVGMGITASSCSMYMILASFLFPWVERSIGTAATFFSLSLISAIGAILIPTLVPETKGRPMGERGDKFTPKQNWLELFQAVTSFCVCCKRSRNFESKSID